MAKRISNIDMVDSVSECLEHARGIGALATLYEEHSDQVPDGALGSALAALQKELAEAVEVLEAWHSQHRAQRG